MLTLSFVDLDPYATWAQGPRSYLGIGVAGFPNMFVVTGPQSPSVLTNMMTSIEQHVEWIADCVRYVRESGARTIEPTPEAEDAWRRILDKQEPDYAT